MVVEMQKLFAELQTSAKKSLDMAPFARSLGMTQVSFHRQQDMHEFIINLLVWIGGFADVASRFGGYFEKDVVSFEDDARDAHFDAFLDISVSVENMRSLAESFRSLIQPDVMDGSNRVEMEDGVLRKCTVTTRISTCPTVLMCHRCHSRSWSSQEYQRLSRFIQHSNSLLPSICDHAS
jgi:hypothetical protein